MKAIQAFFERLAIRSWLNAILKARRKSEYYKRKSESEYKMAVALTKAFYARFPEQKSTVAESSHG